MPAARSPSPRPVDRRTWSEVWHAPEARLTAIEARLKEAGGAVLRGGDFDRWDLELRAGLLGSARLLTSVEEHGAGRQLERSAVWPHMSGIGILVILALAGLGIAAWRDAATAAAVILLGIAAVLALRMLLEAGLAVGGLSAVVTSPDGEAAT